MASHFSCFVLFCFLSVRCSSCPLMASPLTTFLRRYSRFTSFDAILDLIAGPSEIPGELIKPSFRRATARRMQGPGFSKSFAQILMSFIFGAAVAYTSVLPFSTSSGTRTGEHSSQKAALVMTCILVTTLHLILTCLDGTSHEINPKRHNRPLDQRMISYRLTSLLKSIFTSSFTGVFISIQVAFFVPDNHDTTLRESEVWSLIAACVVTAALLALYLHVVDEATRTFLCLVGKNLKRIVTEISDDDRIETYLEVILYSILHADASLVKQLASPPPKKPGFLDLEGEEKKQNLEAIKAMANTLLKLNKDESWTAPLEEDFFLFSILESLGGNSLDGSSHSGLEGADVRHAQNIQLWVQPGDKMTISGSEPFAVPLVRALCTYAGGLGEALIICSAPQSKPTKNSSAPFQIPIGSSWVLPPGAIVCAEYAIQAASRCIIWNFSNSTRALADWRSTHLSMLVPVILNSACRLEAGLVRYAQSRKGGKPSDDDLDNKLGLIKVHCPELLSLFLACNDSAIMILQKLKSLEGVRSVDLELEGDCNKWTKALLLSEHS
jgi:hypothetical protein